MKINELNQFLFQYTKSELKHTKTDRTTLSERYKSIPQISFNDRMMYLFTFNSLLENKYVCINKESRFTFIPEHIHTVIEFVYVYSGHCTQIINGNRITLDQGDICMLDTNVPHSIEYMDQNDIIITIDIRKEYLVQGFLSRLGDNGIINNFFVNAMALNQNHDQYLLFRKQKETQIHFIIQNILCEYYDPSFCHTSVIEAYMVLLFCEILRQYKDEHIKTNENTHLLMDILKYIESNYLTTSLQDTADYFGFHPNYLSTYIKKQTGKSFKELMILQRMYQASFYLVNTEIPIYEVASKIGYNNLGFFYKKFEEIFKMTPQKYREVSPIIK